jgi:hypothetical protein
MRWRGVRDGAAAMACVGSQDKLRHRLRHKAARLPCACVWSTSPQVWLRRMPMPSVVERRGHAMRQRMVQAGACGAACAPPRAMRA